MGFFSWDLPDGAPIRNAWASDGPTPCRLVTNDGREFIENNYQGYGVFSGHDYYDLVAECNGLEDRDAALRRCFPRVGEDVGRPPLKLPRFSRPDDPRPWEELPDPPIAECQGFF